MAKFPPDDPVNALVPHTLKQRLAGSGKGPLAGRTFMVKDLFAIKGHKVSCGNPDWYAAASPAKEMKTVPGSQELRNDHVWKDAPIERPATA